MLTNTQFGQGVAGAVRLCPTCCPLRWLEARVWISQGLLARLAGVHAGCRLTRQDAYTSSLLRFLTTRKLVPRKSTPRESQVTFPSASPSLRLAPTQGEGAGLPFLMEGRSRTLQLCLKTSTVVYSFLPVHAGHGTWPFPMPCLFLTGSP